MPNPSISSYLNVSTTPRSYDFARTPTVWPNAVFATAAGDTTLWTPASGKKFRLLWFMMQLPLGTTMAAAGTLTQILKDGATQIGPFVFSDYLPNTTPTNAIGDNHTTIILPGNGYLSSTVNNALVVNLSAALTAGGARWCVAGTEE